GRGILAHGPVTPIAFVSGRRGGSAGPRLVMTRGVGGIGAVRVEALGLGELLLHRAALLLDLGPLRVRVGATALGLDLLLLGRRGLLLRIQAGAIRLQLGPAHLQVPLLDGALLDRKSTRLNSSHVSISY